MKSQFTLQKVLVFSVLLFSASGNAGGIPVEACLQLCDEVDSKFKRLMKDADIPVRPKLCKLGSGRGSFGIHRSFLTMDGVKATYDWYRKRLSKWNEYRDGEALVLYSGPAVNMKDLDIKASGWDYSERTYIRVELVNKKYGMCKWPTKITININSR